MSNNALGDTTGPDPRTITVNANEAITAGDAVAIDQTGSDDRLPHVVQLDNSSSDEDQVAGVATEDIANGDNGNIVVEGSVIANTASVSQGERLGSGGTAGRFGSEDGAPALALSDGGGTDRAGTNLDSNEAEVLL